MANEVKFNAAGRAERVCSTCKTRKKACDKQLPYCGYCSKRSLACCYSDYSGDASSLTTESTTSADFPIVLSSDSTTLKNMLSLHVWRVLQSSGLPLLELADHFFQSFHTWFPVISPRLFHDTIIAARGDVLPAEFSILVLAMYLITQRRHASKDPIMPEDMYVTVKALFAQTQTILLPSITLVQTSFLITAYEYATERHFAAYISIGTCIRMAQTIGVARIDTLQSYLPQDDYSVLRVLEERSIWWAVVILESSAAFRSPPLSETRGAHIGYFARHAQAALLLDRFLNLINFPLDRHTRYLELKKLDEDVQSFLSLLMSEDRWAKRLGCGAIAHSIKLLFLLHQYHLSHATSAELEADGGKREKMSRAALDTAARIMIDVGNTLLQTRKIETMPLCCAYVSRVAHDHMKNSGSDSFGNIGAKDLAPSVALETVFNTRWTVR